MHSSIIYTAVHWPAWRLFKNFFFSDKMFLVGYSWQEYHSILEFPSSHPKGWGCLLGVPPSIPASGWFSSGPSGYRAWLEGLKEGRAWWRAPRTGRGAVLHCLQSSAHPAAFYYCGPPNSTANQQTTNIPKPHVSQSSNDPFLLLPRSFIGPDFMNKLLSM